MNFKEARQIYNNLKTHILEDMETDCSLGTKTELFARLEEIRNVLNDYELIAALDIADRK